MSISHDMARAMFPEKRAYAWVITKDYLYEEHADGCKNGPECDEKSEVGTNGPGGRFGHCATEEQIEAARQIGRAFRLLDDDGILYYEGKIWTSEEPGDEMDFLPLEDFGMPNAGCTEIQYKKLRYVIVDNLIQPTRTGVHATTRTDAEFLISNLVDADKGRWDIEVVESDEWETL